MKTAVYFALTCVLFAPIVFLALSGQFIHFVILIAYSAFLSVLPKRFWRNIIRANIRMNKILLGV